MTICERGYNREDFECEMLDVLARSKDVYRSHAIISGGNTMNEKTEFSHEVCEELGLYVYRLVDLRNGQTFYMGIGFDDRVFAYVKKVH